ncbi:TPA: hypothetical protein HA297_04355 [Candidatus Woesearchaeota archaeon]|nr:hypothetical protein [Candidatus Woesearchaeota archaeon]
MPRYTGIDESNHGRWPEIYVAVTSDNSADVLPSAKLMGKIRKKGGHDERITEVSSRHPYIHIRITHNQILGYGHRAITVMALVTLLRHFESEAEGLDRVIIDGMLHDTVDEQVLHHIMPRTFVGRLRFEPRADTTYPLVHDADTVASALHRYYDHFRSDKDSEGKYERTRIDLVDPRPHDELLRRLVSS